MMADWIDRNFGKILACMFIVYVVALVVVT